MCDMPPLVMFVPSQVAVIASCPLATEIADERRRPLPALPAPLYCDHLAGSTADPSKSSWKTRVRPAGGGSTPVAGAAAAATGDVAGSPAIAPAAADLTRTPRRDVRRLPAAS